MNDQIVLNRKDLEEMVRLYDTISTSVLYPETSRFMFAGATLILLELLGARGIPKMNEMQREHMRKAAEENNLELLSYAEIEAEHTLVTILSGV